MVAASPSRVIPRHGWRSDSHHRHRPGAPPHGLGNHRVRRGEARLSSPAARSPRTRETLGVRLRQLFDGPSGGARAALAGRGGDRADLRQPRRLGDAEARPGARHRHAGAGAGGVTVAEYAPNAVKKTVVGAGHGDKAQIRAMVTRLLPRAEPDSADAADALAIAITHAHCRPGGGSRPRWRSPRGARHDRQALRAPRRGRTVDADRRCGRRRLRGDCAAADARVAARGRRDRDARHRHPYARGPDQAVRFASDAERAWFRALQTVQGVGAKVALAVLGTLDAGRPRQCRGAAGQGYGRARARRRSQGRRPHRRRTEGQDAGARAGIRPAAGACPARCSRRGVGARCGLGADQSRLWPRRGRGAVSQRRRARPGARRAPRS